MYTSLLSLLRCPDCGGRLELMPFKSRDDEVSEGLLACADNHSFPVTRGIPRMLPDALEEHWDALKKHIPDTVADSVRALVEARRKTGVKNIYDRRTRENFSEEWDNHDLGGRTWGMDLDDRVKWFFLEPLRMGTDELIGKVMLDAGCGNGSQSVAYTKLGLEVIALDLSSGLEHGYAFRSIYRGADPTKVHFIQGDLQRPPLAPASVDLIHSAGVLHHTPNTRQTFRALIPLLRSGGTSYVWVYKYERYVTTIVNSIRAITTRIPASVFARIARLMALPFIAFCATVNALGIRQYSRLSRREAALALMDIFGAPYAHYHSFAEVAAWFKAEGFGEVWSCNESRRGFGVCGRLAPCASEPERQSAAQFAVSAKTNWQTSPLKCQ